jgi:hypothetical protein
MGIIEGKVWKSGDGVAQNDLNQFADNLELATIEDINTGENWATQQHFTTTSKMNEVFDDNTVLSFSTNSTSWTDITNITYPSPMAAESGRVNLIRVQWNALLGQLTAASDIGANNLFGIRVCIETDGGTYYRAYSINKFTGRTWVPGNTFLSPDPINWKPVSGSGILIIPAGIAVNTIKMQAIVKSNLNTLVLDRTNLQIIIARA